MSQRDEDRAKKTARQEAYNRNSKTTINNKKGEQERGGEYAEGHPMSPEWKKKVKSEETKSKIKQDKMNAYYEILKRDKRAENYRKQIQNQKRMSPEERAIDNWEAQNLGTYKKREATIDKYVKQLNQNYNKGAAKERKEQETKGKTVKPDRTAQTLAHNKYKNIHTLSVEERNQVHKSLGLKQAATSTEMNESKPSSGNWTKSSPSREQQYKDRQRTQRINLVKEAQKHKGEGKHTDLNFKNGSSGPDKRPNKSQRPVNKNITYNGRDKTYDKDVKGYETHDWKTPTSIPKPEPEKKTTTKKKTPKGSGEKSGGTNGTPKTQRTTEQLLNDIAGIKSSKGTNKSHRAGTKAEQKQKDEMAKYNKEHGYTKGGK